MKIVKIIAGILGAAAIGFGGYKIYQYYHVKNHVKKSTDTTAPITPEEVYGGGSSERILQLPALHPELIETIVPVNYGRPRLIKSSIQPILSAEVMQNDVHTISTGTGFHPNPTPVLPVSTPVLPRTGFHSNPTPVLPVATSHTPIVGVQTITRANTF